MLAWPIAVDASFVRPTSGNRASCRLDASAGHSGSIPSQYGVAKRVTGRGASRVVTTAPAPGGSPSDPPGVFSVGRERIGDRRSRTHMTAAAAPASVRTAPFARAASARSASRANTLEIHASGQRPLQLSWRCLRGPSRGMHRPGGTLAGYRRERCACDAGRSRLRSGLQGPADTIARR